MHRPRKRRRTGRNHRAAPRNDTPRPPRPRRLRRLRPSATGLAFRRSLPRPRVPAVEFSRATKPECLLLNSIHARHKLLLGWVVALASCGGSSQPAADSGTGTGIGPAGGMVTEPYGAQIIVPAGALATTVDIGLARDLADAPSLAATAIDTAGAGYALTPHGTAFATPVTVRIPFDADRIPSDATPVLFKAEPGGAFTPIESTVSGNMLVANVSDFSWGVPGGAAARPRGVCALVNTNGVLEVASFKIDKARGTLGTPTSTAPEGTGASSVIVHPSRRFAFVINGSSGVAGGASNVAVASILFFVFVVVFCVFF